VFEQRSKRFSTEWKAIVDHLNGADLQQSLDQAEKVQREALAGQW
jgi:hypothetical protein